MSVYPKLYDIRNYNNKIVGVEGLDTECSWCNFFLPFFALQLSD